MIYAKIIQLGLGRELSHFVEEVTDRTLQVVIRRQVRVRQPRARLGRRPLAPGEPRLDLAPAEKCDLI